MLHFLLPSLKRMPTAQPGGKAKAIVDGVTKFARSLTGGIIGSSTDSNDDSMGQGAS